MCFVDSDACFNYFQPIVALLLYKVQKIFTFLSFFLSFFFLNMIMSFLLSVFVVSSLFVLGHAKC